MVGFIGEMIGKLIGPVVLKTVGKAVLVAGTTKAIEIGAKKIAQTIETGKGSE